MAKFRGFLWLCVCVCTYTGSVVSNSLQPYRLYSQSGSSVHGIFQARIVSGLLFPTPGDLPNPGVEPKSLYISCIGRQILYHCATWEAPCYIFFYPFINLSVDGHLGCFYILEIINNAAVNVEVHVSFWISFFFFRYTHGVAKETLFSN